MSDTFERDAELYRIITSRGFNMGDDLMRKLLGTPEPRPNDPGDAEERDDDAGDEHGDEGGDEHEGETA